MHNFVLHNRTKIIFGRDTVSQIGAETRAFGRRVLLVFGRESCRRNGVYQEVKGSLEEAGIEVVEHGGVRSNPVLSHVRDGVELARRAAVEAVVAVGGGSVIDTGKAIAAGALVGHDVWQFFRGKKGVKDALPLTCVLTLAGAGSEMNGGMVVTNEETREKFGFGSRHLLPRVSILDPETTFSVPRDYTAYGAVDAVAHVLEFYCTASEPQTPVQDRLMEGLVVNLMASCQRALKDPRDYRARAELMWCATMALNGWTAAGLGRVGMPMHLIAHSLGALYDLPHGACLAAVMPGWLVWRRADRPDKVAQLAERVFDIRAGAASERADQGIDRLAAWIAAVGCPVSLTGLGVGAESIPAIADNTRGLARLWRLDGYSPEVVAAILAGCR